MVFFLHNYTLGTHLQPCMQCLVTIRNDYTRFSSKDLTRQHLIIRPQRLIFFNIGTIGAYMTYIFTLRRPTHLPYLFTYL